MTGARRERRQEWRCAPRSSLRSGCAAVSDRGGRLCGVVGLRHKVVYSKAFEMGQRSDKTTLHSWRPGPAGRLLHSAIVVIIPRLHQSTVNQLTGGMGSEKVVVVKFLDEEVVARSSMIVGSTVVGRTVVGSTNTLATAAFCAVAVAR